MPFDLPLNTTFAREVLLTVLVIGTALMVGFLGKRLIKRYVDVPEHEYRAVRYFRRALALVAGLIILIVWSPGLRDVVTILTVVGAGFAIALREVLLSLAAWLRLNVRPLYRQGDRIEIGDTVGDVVDVRLLHTTLMEVNVWVGGEQSNGRLVHLPNGRIFQEPVRNYTEGFGFLWNEFDVTVTFESDWKAARQMMQDYAEADAGDTAQRASRQLRRLAREYLIHYDVLTPYVYTEITERGVRLTLRYLCEVRGRRSSEHRLTEHLLERFRDHGGVELAAGVRASVRSENGAAWEAGRRAPSAGEASPSEPSSAL